MKKIVTFEFKKNGATVGVYYGKPPKRKAYRRFKDDILWLEWKTWEGDKSGIGMRPDEALLVAEMLVEAVRITTHGFATSRPISNYSIDKKV